MDMLDLNRKVLGTRILAQRIKALVNEIFCSDAVTMDPTRHDELSETLRLDMEQYEHRRPDAFVSNGDAVVEPDNMDLLDVDRKTTSMTILEHRIKGLVDKVYSEDADGRLGSQRLAELREALELDMNEYAEGRNSLRIFMGMAKVSYMNNVLHV